MLLKRRDAPSIAGDCSEPWPPDTELLVANPVEISGKGKTRSTRNIHALNKYLSKAYCENMFVNLTIKSLYFMLPQGDIVKLSTQERHESGEFPLISSEARNQIVGKARRTLTAW